MEKYCKFCGTQLAASKRSHAIFCSVKCKKAEQHKRRVENPDKKEQNRLRCKAWREKNLQQAKEKVSAWQKANRGRCTAMSRKYLLKKAQAVPPWLTKEQERLLSMFYQERDRLNAVTGIQHEVDHIVPLQGKTVCGLHVPWNLQVLTKKDNISKRHFYWPDMWHDPDTTLLAEVD
jgi:hypothetical protein